MKHQIGILGLIVGLIAIGIAIFQNDLRPNFPKPPEPAVQSDPSLKELAVEAGKKLIKEKFLDKDEPSSGQSGMSDELKDPHDSVALTYMGLGFLAMILGVASWVKKDHIRISGGAVALGLMAVAWQYVLIGVVIAIVIVVLANLSA